MSRILLGTWLVALLAMAVPALNWAAEKTVKDAASSASALNDVHAALQAEATGDNERRSGLLYKAWLAAQDLPEANWHTGRVQIDGQWVALGEAASRAARDPDLEKYDQLREHAANPRAIRELARWCQKHAMQDRARLHWAQLLAAGGGEPAWRQEAIAALGLERVGASWFTREELADRRQQAREAHAALEKWLPKLRPLALEIDGDDYRRRDAAIVQFHELNDAQMVVPLEASLESGGPRFQEEAVKRLAAFPEYEATLALLKYAVLSPHALVRRSAMQSLKDRPLHEFVPVLIGGLQSPLQVQFQVKWDARGRVSYDRAVFQEGATGNLLLRTYIISSPAMARSFLNLSPGTVSPSTKAQNKFGNTANRIEAAEAMRGAAWDQALADQTLVSLTNGQRDAQNQRIFDTLEEATREQLQRTPQAWRDWWQDYNEYQWPKPTYCYYQTSAKTYYVPQIQLYRQTSCFAAGTSVRTETGPRPIESIKPGDRVLSQDPDTGELAYKIVLKTTLRPPASMLRLTIGDDTIATTLGHPFWVDGYGWKMAKELTTGDLLHALGGAIRVDKVEPVADDKAYNLVVDDFNTYFVGLQGILVHDNEFRRPTLSIVPGLVTSAKAE